MFLIRYLRERLIQKKVNLEADFYNTTSNELVLENQLSMFNVIWQNIQNNVPLYSSLVQKGKAPKTSPLGMISPNFLSLIEMRLAKT